MRIGFHNTAGVRRVLLAVALILGELLGFACRPIASIWPVLAGIVATVALAAWGWRLRGWLLPVLCGFGFIFALRTDAGLSKLLESNTADFATRPSYQFVVESEATRWSTSKKGQWRTSFLSHLGAVPVKVIMPTTAISDLPATGETWLCKGWIGEKTPNGNRYARRTFWVARLCDAQRIRSPSRYSAAALYTALNRNLMSRLTAGLDWCPELARLNCAILLGQRNGLSREKRQLFADAGTIHIFAISGLHVMVVALLLRKVLLRLGFIGCAQSLMAIPLLWVYTIVTGLRPSAVRAALMATFWLSAPIFGRRPDSLSAWATTALLVYGLHPERIFDIGSTLSFAVMFGIVLWVEWTKNFQPLFRDGFRTGRFASIFSEQGKANRLLSSFGISLAAWVAGVPIAAAVFGRFTPGGLLANLAVLYCADKMVRIGIGGLLVSFICLPLAALFNNCAAGLTWLMTELSRFVARLSFSSWTIAPWSLSTCLLWYGSWIAIFLFVGRFLPTKAAASKRWWT